MGMGYGTTLTPTLIILGYEPLIIVPAILFSEFLSGLLAGGFHEHFGNAHLQSDSREKQSLLILITAGIIGVIIATIAIISLPSIIVKLYIAFLVIAMGFIVLSNGNSQFKYSKKRIGMLGIVCSFNKGISGGGYGPLAVSGQIVSGVEPKSAVAITSVSEGIICLAGFLLYSILRGILYPLLLLGIAIGALIATPISAYTITKVEGENLVKIVGLAMLALGLFTLWSVFIQTL
jgi:uncharacterized membrane protein YfcA